MLRLTDGNNNVLRYKVRLVAKDIHTLLDSKHLLLAIAPFYISTQTLKQDFSMATVIFSSMLSLKVSSTGSTLTKSHSSPNLSNKHLAYGICISVNIFSISTLNPASQTLASTLTLKKY